MVAEALNLSQNHNNILANFIPILCKKHTAITAIASRIIAKSRQMALPVRLDEYVASLVHMSVNRTMTSQQRLHEMVIYDFLYRFYESEWARFEKTKQLE